MEGGEKCKYIRMIDAGAISQMTIGLMVKYRLGVQESHPDAIVIVDNIPTWKYVYIQGVKKTLLSNASYAGLRLDARTLPTVNQPALHHQFLYSAMHYGWSFAAPVALLTIPGQTDPPFCVSSPRFLP